MITVSDDIIICAFRYAFGRMTYITAVVGDMLIENKANLSAKTRRIISQEIIDGLAKGHGGMDCDIQVWNRVLEEFQKQP